MRALFTLLIISLGSIKISTCPEPPRMNINFQYNGSIKDIMPTIKDYLESQEYDIIHYAPESGFILTDYKLFKLNTGKVFLALSININDLVVVVGMGKYEIVTSGIGNPDDILKIKTCLLYTSDAADE